MRAPSLFALVLALSGCTAEVRDSPGVVTGFLTVDWSISGSQGSAACRQSDADRINVALQTVDGIDLGEFEDVCEAFQTTIELAPDDYTGNALLLDPSGTPRTTAVGLGRVQIFSDEELVVPIDFPSDSFY